MQPDVVVPGHEIVDTDVEASQDDQKTTAEVWIHAIDLDDARDQTVTVLSQKKASQILSKRTNQVCPVGGLLGKAVS